MISLPQLFLAGSIAGIMNAIVLTPVERVKCVLQAQEAAKKNKNVSATEYKGSLDCAQQLYRKGGIKNLYQGLEITIIRGKLNLAIQIYDLLYRCTIICCVFFYL